MGCRRTVTGFLKETAWASRRRWPTARYSPLFRRCRALGLLGLLHLYDRVQTLLGSVAPRGVIHSVKGLQKDSHGGASVAARARGLAGAVWPASGAMTIVIKAVNHAYKLEETRPFWQKRPITIELVVATAVTLIGIFVLLAVGAPLVQAIANKAHLGGAFTLLWAIPRWPVAFAAILVFHALVYCLARNKAEQSWKRLTPGSLLGGVLWRCTRRSPVRTRRRTARSRAGSS